MSIPVHTATRIVFVGDSITAAGWFDETQSLVGGTDLLVQQLSQPEVTARVGAASGTAGRASGSVGACAPVTGGGQVYAINSGVPGNQSADIAANVPTRITAHAPEVVVLFIGVNDVRDVPVPVTANQFETNVDSIVTQTQAANPGVPIVIVSILCFREQWLSSPPPAHFSGNPVDAGPEGIDAFNARLVNICIARGCTYVDARAAGGLSEATLNTPEPGAIDGFLTGDGIHPLPAGQSLLSTSAFPAFAFTP